MNPRSKLMILIVSPAVMLSLWSFLMINGCAREGGRTMLRAKVNGLSVAYERTGNGPALILLHGFTHDSRVWRPQLESLSAQFTVIAWDAPGAGQSSDPWETFGISD